MENKKVENKKQMSNKKKFWVGMSALAAVGIITTTVAWFTSSHQFTNKFNIAKTGVTVTQLLDRTKALKMVPGRKENLDIKVKNTSTEEPMLARIKYVSVGKNDTEANLSTNLAEEVGLNVEGYEQGYLFTAAKDSKFAYSDPDDGGDGWYYYVGVIPAGTEVQHLDYVTLATDYVGIASNKYYTSEKENPTAEGDWTEWQGTTPNNTKGFRGTLTSEDAISNIAAVIETTQATYSDGTILDDDYVNSVGAARDAWDHPSSTPEVGN